jgi:hypothetical protein
MSAAAQTILRDLAIVDAERVRRGADASLAAAVPALKAYQQERFRRTYADLLASAEYAATARFFLEELYGPRDFSDRDAQFARVVPALVRLFSEEIIGTVAALAELHALSERLDSRTAATVELPVDAPGYGRAWRKAGTPAERERQIALTLRVGNDLERLTRKPLLRQSLKLMRGPAVAAGLGALQSFLESGFETFRTMRHPAHFLGCIASRERALADALFAPGEGEGSAAVLGQLP